jgi:hypothetical protein
MIAGLTASALAVPQQAQAGLTCSPFNNFGVRECTAGIQIGAMTARQNCPYWCWAACIETIFALKGFKVPQQAIVSKIFGSPICNTAVGPQIIGAINGYWTDLQGKRFKAMAQPLVDLQFGIANPAAMPIIARELNNNNPLINGALGHATLITAMRYKVDYASRGIPLEIWVRDPWPGNPNRRRLKPQERAGTFFLAAVRVT